MIDPLISVAEHRPEAPALRDSSGQWTWRQLLAHASGFAQRLGPAVGGRAALLARDTRDAVMVIHAARLAGATLVPLNRRLTPGELAPMLRRSGVGLLLHDGANGPLATGLATELGHALPDLRLIAIDDRSLPIRMTSPDRLDAADSAVIVFTSGTTGEPRGAKLTYGNLLASAGAWNGFLESRPTDHWLAALPLSHVAGLGVVLRSVSSGALLTVHDRFDPVAVRAALADEGVTHVSLVPTQLARLLDDGPVKAPALRALLLGGAPIRVELVRRAIAAGLPVVSTYGLTEAGSGVTALGLADAERYPGSAGRPLAGTRVRVLDERGHAVSPGTAGVVAVSGPTVFAGYDGDAGATAAALHDGWLHTGDLGTLDGGGRLTILDRRDDLIISGGENVSPAEVETVLLSHPDIVDAAVAGRPDPKWGAVPVAAVVGRPGTSPDTAAIESFARGRLAGFKVPVSLGVVSAIPRTASGKILRRQVGRLLDLLPVDTMIDRPDGARIHVRRRGSGPALVLLHATLSNALELDPLSMALAEHWTVLAIDRRSAGASSMPPGDALVPVDVQVHIDDITAVLDAMTPDHRAFVVGHSYGACVGLELAARRPDRVIGAWLFEPPYLSVLPDATDDDAAALGRRIAGLAQEAGLGAAALAFLETINGPDVLRRLPPEAIARFEQEGRGAVADAALLGFRPDGLRDILAPVIVSVGGRSRGPYVQIADDLEGRIVRCSVERFAALGHGGPISQPRVVADAINAFAQRAGHAGRPAPPPGGTP